MWKKKRNTFLGKSMENWNPTMPNIVSHFSSINQLESDVVSIFMCKLITAIRENLLICHRKYVHIFIWNIAILCCSQTAPSLAPHNRIRCCPFVGISLTLKLSFPIKYNYTCTILERICCSVVCEVIAALSSVAWLMPACLRT